MQYYDIIGDVHGHATKLENLLLKMNYRLVDGVFCHETRKAIFVGDYIDRGGEEEKTIHMVKSMVESNSALAIMGNHEFNAICYATKKPNRQDQYLREHSEKNHKQHQAFLKEFPFGSQKHEQVIKWFKTLPIFLELEHIRIVHACWHQPTINKLNDLLNKDKTIPDEMFITASQEHHNHYQYIENVVKALEQELPDGITFNDKDENSRSGVRVKWWSNETPTFRNLALTVPGENMESIPNSLIDDIYLYDNDKPVFFGHYWMNGKPSIQSDKVVCTDYSAGKGGDLIAYRWSGERNLINKNFVY
ncbi:metallophosphoesterase [Shewanella olleyana]|uniref:metallophosphoesterase n=1 Tax=Shewanella olleyana TaxID=135626 RepID=UPI00200CAFF4|nr:metallophosphoesterase [Shewanella olleyana]MCL1067221.1 metallophosphoesterase [Shewanella olleyana]